MSLAEPAVANSVVAVYPDHFAAERAIRQLHEAGFDLGELSIVGRNFQETVDPYANPKRGDYIKVGTESGYYGRPDVDGALIGGASLDADQLLDIIRAVAREP